MSGVKLTRDEILKLIEQIDHYRLIQGTHWSLAQYPDAIKAAEDIIDLAYKGRLLSIVKEQLAFIRQFMSDYVLPQKVILEKETAELLQRTFEKSIKAETEIEIEQISKAPDEKISQQEKKKKLIEKIESSIEDILNLKEKFQFHEAKIKIDGLIDSIKGKDLQDYIKKLEKLREEVIAAEEEYNIKKEMEASRLDDIKKNIEKLSKEALKLMNKRKVISALRNYDNITEILDKVVD